MSNVNDTTVESQDTDEESIYSFTSSGTTVESQDIHEEAIVSPASPRPFMRAFHVGYSVDSDLTPVFLEAPITFRVRVAPQETDAANRGIRFLTRDGREHRGSFIPRPIVFKEYALFEIKKYLWCMPVEWLPEGLEPRQMTRDRDGEGPVEKALCRYFRI